MTDEMKTTEADIAFVAGLLSFAGSFMVVKSGDGAVVRFALRSVDRPGAVERLAKFAGVNVVKSPSNNKPADMVTMQGGVLHSVMKLIWSELSDDRKKTYANARKRARNKEFARAANRQENRKANAERIAG